MKEKKTMMPVYVLYAVMLLYAVMISLSYWFNKMLTGQYSGRKFKQGDQIRKILGRGKSRARHRRSKIKIPY